MSRSELCIGIVGCGAITEVAHLPALRSLGQRNLVLIDTNASRAEALARSFRARSSADLPSVIGELDAAVIATPPSFHAPLCIDLLTHGVDVLVEKPMASRTRECRNMIAACGENRVLAVGLMRRHLCAHRWLRSLLAANGLGRILRFEFLEGGPFGWPLASNDLWSKAKSGGGVLADTGAHTLDQLLWWLGDVKELAYRDDARGGVEAECRIDLTMASGAKGIVVLSRTRSLPGQATIVGEHGKIVVDLVANRVQADPATLLDFKDEQGSGHSFKAEGFRDLHRNQMKDWLDAVITRRRPLVTGEDGLRSVELIESCYRCAKPLRLPWETLASSAYEKVNLGETQ